MSDEMINEIEAPSFTSSDDAAYATGSSIILPLASTSDPSIPLHLETPLANADSRAYSSQEAKRVSFATSRGAADEGEGHGLSRDLPPHLRPKTESDIDSRKERASKEPEGTGSPEGSETMYRLLERMSVQFDRSFAALESRLDSVERLSISPFPENPKVVNDRTRRSTTSYGRTPVPVGVPFDLGWRDRPIPSLAAIDSRIRIPAPSLWKGTTNDFAALELFITQARGYLLAMGKFSIDDALVDEPVRHLVASLFSSEKKLGTISPLQWIHQRFESVAASGVYTLADVFDDMRRHWDDPRFGERMLKDLSNLRQGGNTANVYGAHHLSLVSSCPADELTPAIVVRSFLDHLNPRVEPLVRVKVAEETIRQRKLGLAFAPSHEELVEWASLYDYLLVTAIPSASLSAISSSRAVSSSIPRSPAPRTSKIIPRAFWDEGASRFQAKYLIADRASWPLGRSDPTPDSLNCWNCAKRGHWSLNCTNGRVLPGVAVLAAIRATSLAGDELEMDEYEEYGRDSQSADDLMHFA